MADEPPRIRVCGVPEHFNVPWRTLAEANPNIEWINAPGGTGAMMEGLRNGYGTASSYNTGLRLLCLIRLYACMSGPGSDFDIIIALTESLIAGIEKGGNNEKLLGCYVQSKLNWAVTVGADSAVTSYDDLKPAQKSTTFAISRHGSGSETMAFVMAGQLGWPKDPGINFQVCHTFDEMTRRVNLPQDDPEHCDAQVNGQTTVHCLRFFASAVARAVRRLLSKAFHRSLPERCGNGSPRSPRLWPASASTSSRSSLGLMRRSSPHGVGAVASPCCWTSALESSALESTAYPFFKCDAGRPCFSIAATTKTCADPAKREYLNELFKELETHCEQFKANKDGASIARKFERARMSMRFAPGMQCSHLSPLSCCLCGRTFCLSLIKELCVATGVMKDHGLNEEDARTWFYGGPGVGTSSGQQLLTTARAMLQSRDKHSANCVRLTQLVSSTQPGTKLASRRSRCVTNCARKPRLYRSYQALESIGMQ
eukprot:SAG31_NODE_1187_length_9483_cov_16.723146_5_plen_484_part_00